MDWSLIASKITSWPFLLSVLLIVMKQVFKLYIYHKPSWLDHFKSIVALPVDLSFLIVALFVKAAFSPSPASGALAILMVGYLITSFFVTVLWRVCDNSCVNQLGRNLVWALPLNFALAITTLVLATHFVTTIP